MIPGGLEVDKSYYDAPQYEGISTNPPGVTFPIITLPGIGATIVPSVQNFEVNGASISSGGFGYPRNPKIGFAPPPITVQTNCNIRNRRTSTLVVLVQQLDLILVQDIELLQQ